MTDEEVVRLEAYECYQTEVAGSEQLDSPIDIIMRIKERLSNFYSNDNKAIFLDQIQKQIVSNLQKHRSKSHGGNAMPTCVQEIFAEKLIFYINQEINSFPKIIHATTVQSNTQQRNKVFLSYAHADKAFLHDIKRHFKPFLSDIDFWDDSRIDPGKKWKEEIRNAINNTKIAILLVSTDYLGSEFISSDELPPLLYAAENDGATILTMIVKPCLFEEFPKLSQYQAMNNPNHPVSKMDENEREELFVNLVRQTKKILNKD
jgi:hypothetical protein